MLCVGVNLIKLIVRQLSAIMYICISIICINLLINYNKKYYIIVINFYKAIYVISIIYNFV